MLVVNTNLRVGLVSRARDARVPLVDLLEVLVDGDGEQGVPVPAHQAQLDLVADVDLEREVINKTFTL